jgi:hypothetical protein
MHGSYDPDSRCGCYHCQLAKSFQALRADMEPERPSTIDSLLDAAQLFRWLAYAKVGEIDG